MVGFGAIRPNAGGAPHSRSSSVASSGTPPPAAAASTSSTSSTRSSSSIDGGQPPARPHHTLEAPSRKHHRSGSSSSKPARLFQKLRNALPLVLAPRCGRPVSSSANPFSSGAGAGDASHVAAGRRRPCRRVTGTLYGHRKGRVALALQESPRAMPSLVVELALQTHALLRELGNPAGARIVLETERRGAAGAAGAAALLEEAAWTMFCNGRKTGYAVRREASGGDLVVMETLRAVSMGAGVLPASAAGNGAGDDEVAYMRGFFEHFVGSRDSESLYMMPPQAGGNGPELAVFFVRL